MIFYHEPQQTSLTQFLQECKDTLSREAEKVHFVTLVFRTVAYSQGITVTLLFFPHPDFDPVAIRTNISGFSCYSYLFQLGLHYNFSLHSATAWTDCLVSSFQQNCCCRKCYSTKEPKKPKQSILVGASKMFQLYQKKTPEGKGFLVPQSAQKQNASGRIMLLNVFYKQ